MTTFTAYRLFAQPGSDVPQGRFVEMDIDDLSAGDVVIRVAYSSINYKDALAAAGINRIIRDFPRIGGIDLVGHVAASRDARLREGDPVVVHGFGIGVDHDGGHAQYARVSADWVMPLPQGLDLLEAGILGAAGYTAGLCLHWMEHDGLTPESGKVLVTGATGGVASVAIDMLAQRGYPVTAMTGKAGEHAYLRELGASEIVPASSVQPDGKPLEKALWAGAIDSVGGETLGWLLRTMQPDGIVTSFGNAGGAAFNATVLPFILRGIRLIGINANSPMPLRRVVWQKMANEYHPRKLASIANVIDFDALPQAMENMRNRATRGRTIIRMHS
jgi:putative YhdH/YhfP family quinone oxidoreductase